MAQQDVSNAQPSQVSGSTHPAAKPRTLRDTFYIWGQDPGTHHRHGLYNLPGENRMTPAEGCAYFGIPNCCRVVMDDLPLPPFDEHTRALAGCREVIWSAVGSFSSTRNKDGKGDLDEAIRQATLFPNVKGVVLDDFLNAHVMEIFSPAQIQAMRQRIRQAVTPPLDLWVVWYEHQLDDPAVLPYLELVDVITFWTWHGDNIPQVEANLERAFATARPGQRVMAGCYMWDYGDARPLGADRMAHQLDVYRRLIHAGRLDGVVLCSNCIADVGIPEVEQTRQWLVEHGDEAI